eukprot:gene233-283_t
MTKKGSKSEDEAPQEQIQTPTTGRTRRIAQPTSASKDYVYFGKNGKEKDDTSPSDSTPVAATVTPKRVIVVQNPLKSEEKKRKGAAAEETPAETSPATKRVKNAPAAVDRTPTHATIPLSLKRRSPGGASGDEQPQEPITPTPAARPLKLTIRLGQDKLASTITSKEPATTSPPTPTTPKEVKTPSKRSNKKKSVKEEEAEEEEEEEEEVATPSRATPKRSAGAVKREAGTPDTTAAKRTYTAILAQLIKKDINGYFMMPVTEEIAPNYFQHIKEPMDFHTMKQKNQENKYTSIEQFLYDFTLICENCMRYNESESTYYKEAKRLLGVGRPIVMSYAGKLAPEPRPMLTGPVTATPSASTLRERSGHNTRTESAAPTPSRRTAKERKEKEQKEEEAAEKEKEAAKPIAISSSVKHTPVTRTKSKPVPNQAVRIGQPAPAYQQSAPVTPTVAGQMFPPGAAFGMPGGPPLPQIVAMTVDQYTAPQSSNISLPKRKYVKLGVDATHKSQTIPPLLKPSHSMTKAISEGKNVMITPADHAGPSTYTMYIPKDKNRPDLNAGSYEIVGGSSVPHFLERVTNYQMQQKHNQQRQEMYLKQQQEYMQQQQQQQQQQQEEDGEDEEEEEEGEEEENEEEQQEEMAVDQQQQQEQQEQHAQQDQSTDPNNNNAKMEVDETTTTTTTTEDPLGVSFDRQSDLSRDFGAERSIHLNGLANYLYVKHIRPTDQRRKDLIFKNDLPIKRIPNSSLAYLNRQITSLISNGRLEVDEPLKEHLGKQTRKHILNRIKDTNNTLVNNNIDNNNNTSQPDISSLKEMAASLQSQGIDMSFLQSAIPVINDNNNHHNQPSLSASTNTSPIIQSVDSPIGLSSPTDQQPAITTQPKTSPLSPTTTNVIPKTSLQLLEANFEELCKLQLTQYYRNVPTPSMHELQVASVLHSNIGKLGVVLPPSMYIKSRESLRQTIIKSGLHVGSGRQPRPNFIQSKKDILSPLSAGSLLMSPSSENPAHSPATNGTSISTAGDMDQQLESTDTSTNQSPIMPEDEQEVEQQS